VFQDVKHDEWVFDDRERWFPCLPVLGGQPTVSPSLYRPSQLALQGPIFTAHYSAEPIPNTSR